MAALPVRVPAFRVAKVVVLVVAPLTVLAPALVLARAVVLAPTKVAAVVAVLGVLAAQLVVLETVVAVLAAVLAAVSPNVPLVVTGAREGVPPVVAMVVLEATVFVAGRKG